MKIILLKNKSTYTILAIIIFLMVSCSNNDTIKNPLNDNYLQIPDIHFETKLIEQGIDSDGVVNQQILKTDAEKVSRLDLNLNTTSGEIIDLTGIEGFINLTLLSAGNQKLENIDLSYNTILDTLYLSGNLINSIDLSNNSNLIFVDLQNNEFSSSEPIVGLSDLPKLEYLDLSWNYLEEFTIYNESLKFLHISHNDLKTIDSHGANNLQLLFAPSNKLESLDFSANTLLQNIFVAGNKLKQIDLETNTSLTHLYISGNLLTSLDVSNNLELIDLRVSNNPELTCIKIENIQNFYVMKSEYQILNNNCN